MAGCGGLSFHESVCLIARLVAARNCSMSSQDRTRNPFYPLLVLVGLAFAITACGFAVMMVRGINPTGEFDAPAGGGLLEFFREHGFTAMMIELVVLALATCGAIATDELWSDRAAAAAKKELSPDRSNTPGELPPPED